MKKSKNKSRINKYNCTTPMNKYKHLTVDGKAFFPKSKVKCFKCFVSDVFFKFN